MDRRAFLWSASSAAAVPNAFGGSRLGDVDEARGGEDALFAAWRQGFIDRASGAGWPRARLSQVLGGLRPDPRVIAADHRQPELSKPIGDYVQATVSSARVDEGRSHWTAASAWLESIAEASGVSAGILVAIWGVESSFGRLQGDYDVIRSLATLAAEGRRKAWAEAQLYEALRILFTGEANREQLTGSWAGAMGQTQFTPSDYLAWAVDGDGDGRRDIWRSAPDALASAANFLQHKAAWRRGEGWAREVSLPRAFDYGLSEGPKQPIEAWESLGVRTADGAVWRKKDLQEAAGLILPSGWNGPAFLVLPNHFAIRAYNNSMVYALSVGLIADRVAGGAPLTRAWPQDQPVSLADRIAAQEALNRLGFDSGTPDGVLGLQTRQAARGWQKRHGLPADGYLNAALIARLKKDGGFSSAGLVPPT